MGRQFSLVLILLICACDVVSDMKLVRRQPVANAPEDAREIAPHTYVKTMKADNSGVPVEALPVFGYVETINPQSPGDSVTSLEEGRRESIPAGLVSIFAGARTGETRRVWTCSGTSRSLCLVSEYTFYRQLE